MNSSEEPRVDPLLMRVAMRRVSGFGTYVESKRRPSGTSWYSKHGDEGDAEQTKPSDSPTSSASSVARAEPNAQNTSNEQLPSQPHASNSSLDLCVGASPATKSRPTSPQKQGIARSIRSSTTKRLAGIQHPSTAVDYAAILVDVRTEIGGLVSASAGRRAQDVAEDLSPPPRESQLALRAPSTTGGATAAAARRKSSRLSAAGAKEIGDTNFLQLDVRTVSQYASRRNTTTISEHNAIDAAGPLDELLPTPRRDSSLPPTRRVSRAARMSTRTSVASRAEDPHALPAMAGGGAMRASAIARRGQAAAAPPPPVPMPMPMRRTRRSSFVGLAFGDMEALEQADLDRQLHLRERLAMREPAAAAVEADYAGKETRERDTRVVSDARPRTIRPVKAESTFEMSTAHSTATAGGAQEFLDFSSFDKVMATDSSTKVDAVNKRYVKSWRQRWETMLLNRNSDTHRKRAVDAPAGYKHEQVNIESIMEKDGTQVYSWVTSGQVAEAKILNATVASQLQAQPSSNDFVVRRPSTAGQFGPRRLSYFDRARSQTAPVNINLIADIMKKEVEVRLEVEMVGMVRIF
ncbi:hypothetical protein HDU84_005641 [Entophlyctis sp. JEL0112]|nr:hypothetical protein HDU84_005641 [Entophlyctis sp. JEL0112]